MKMFLLSLIALIVAFGLHETAKSDTGIMNINIPEKLIVLLAENPDSTSSKIKLQDFNREGHSFFPVFSSQSMFDKSTGGTKLPFPKYEFARPLLLGLFSGNEKIILDVDTDNEHTYYARDLKERYSTEISEFNENVKRKAQAN